jgi:hypothetical protein
LSDDLLELIRPAWILLLVGGCFWASAASVIAPPSFRSLPSVFLAGVAGAFLGQAVADVIVLGDPRLGDVHAIAASVGALTASLVVRRLVA